MIKDKVQIVAKNECPYLDMKMSWSPEGYLKFLIFRKKGQKLNYFGKLSIHTPSNLRAVPSGVLNRPAKLTLCKPKFHSERLDSVYPDHANYLSKAGLEPPIFLTMRELWKG